MKKGMERLKTALTEKVTIYIPATINIESENGGTVSTPINNAPFVKEAAKMLSNLYGGCTACNVSGFWYSDARQQLERENTTTIYAFSDNIESGLDTVIDFCEYLKKALKQDAISLEINGKLYFI